MSLRIASENDFLTLVDRYFDLTTSHQLSLRGDDCAELAVPETICISSDLFLEDVHFRTSYFSFYEIGYKALAVNLSDLSAAGAVPLGFNMNLILPVTTSRSAVEQLLRGMSEIASEYSLPLTGGDLSRGQKLGLCITIWGKQGGQKFLRRGGCRSGDTLFLAADSPSLPLGLARAGLYSLEKLGREEAISVVPSACKRHLMPAPLVRAGIAVAKLAPETALMDLSDGLARDLPRLLGHSHAKQGLNKRNSLCEKNPSTCILGAEIMLAESSLHNELQNWCTRFGLNPIEQAVLGGEDYLLLGSTNDPEQLKAVEAEAEGIYCFVIGKVNESGGLIVNGNEFFQSGFDHFSA